MALTSFFGSAFFGGEFFYPGLAPVAEEVPGGGGPDYKRRPSPKLAQSNRDFRRFLEMKDPAFKQLKVIRLSDSRLIAKLQGHGFIIYRGKIIRRTS